MKALFLSLFCTATLCACAYNDTPVVDTTGIDSTQYQQDLAYCEKYARQVDKGEAASTQALNGAATGAVVGAVAGAIEEGIGGAVGGALAGGAIGAGAGALGGANDATDMQAKVLRVCLKEKGYKSTTPKYRPSLGFSSVLPIGNLPFITVLSVYDFAPDVFQR